MARKSGSKPKTASTAKKRIHRSSKNRVVLGVLGGLAEHFETNPMYLRVLWIAVIVVVGLVVGVFAYALIPTVLAIWTILYVIAYLLMNDE